ncbi:MAG: glutamate formimidoyltransferase [Myxococcaceae bacterium]|nr:glutamate formimidoyltransferase [Myxococcaceae bacterium]
MPRIVECVPNFSEGRDAGKLKQLTSAIEAVSGVQLLNVEPGADTNRTVVTFVGEPEAVLEAAFQAIAKAASLIDMTTHRGAHPRMGATDVCPFVPVEGVTMAECVELAKRLGERVGRELGIPVFLYEEAATSPTRRNLADIRKGEYEGLAKKLADPAWRPDYGPAAFNAKSGGTVIGAREFLIAWNINLNSTDKNHAAEIAYELRERGRVARTGNTKPFYYRGKELKYAAGAFPCGSCAFVGASYAEVKAHCAKEHGYDLDALLVQAGLDLTALENQKVYRPGLFKHCKAIGWYVEDYKRAQISINMTNYKVTPLHVVYDEARKLAAERGLVVTGSEIVGLVPFQALLEAGRHYQALQGKSAGAPLIDVLRCAVSSLGLSDVAPFDLEKKVLGLPATSATALVTKTVKDFTDEVSRDTPAPGGGSIAALAGSLGAALASMVATLTHGKEGTEARDAELARVAAASQRVKDGLLALVDEDTNAFNGFMEARRLPQGTAEEKALRKQKMQEGLKAAIDVPWRTAELSFEALQLAKDVSVVGNPNSLTDAAVGAQMAFAGVRGALWNVVINLKDLADPPYVEAMQRKSAELHAKARALADESGAAVDARLQEMIAKKKA